MGYGRQYTIGSFNVNNLSRSTSTRYRASQIADILRHEGMDLVAFQEVIDADALIPILGSLGPNWDSVWINSRPKQGMPDVDHDPRGEGYAFLWDKRRLRKIQTTLLNGSEEIDEPKTFDHYRVDKSLGQKELIRDPVFGRFTASGLGGGNFELRLLCDHIRYNGISEEKDRFFWPMRHNEFDVLAKTLYPRLADAQYGTQMPAYTIVLGDYNMNLQRIWTKQPYMSAAEETVLVDQKKIITVQDQLTTLKKPNYKKPEEKTAGYQHNYDHFSYDAGRLSSLNPVARRIDIVANSYYSIYYGDYDRYREEISDHLPIVLTLNPA